MLDFYREPPDGPDGGGCIRMSVSLCVHVSASCGPQQLLHEGALATVALLSQMQVLQELSMVFKKK